MPRSTIVKNTAANLIGQFVSKGLKILLVPIQINMLGEQAFGLVGFYALVLGLVAFLDLGLSLTVNREVSRLNSARLNDVQAVRILVRTFEIPYWIIGGTLGVIVTSCAGWLSDNWITASDLPRQTIVSSISIIGLMVALRWPVSLYRGVLFGLQHQVQTNLLAITSEVVTGVGSVLIIFLDPRLEAFFLWQLIASFLEIAIYIWYCWRILSDARLPRPYFNFDELKRVWRFALGVNATTLIGSILGRADGLILSKLLPINCLGYYSIAQRIPFFIGMFPASLITATNPSLVDKYERGEYSQLSQLYSRQTRWLTFVGTGLAGALAAFSYPILLLWTQSEQVANNTALAFSIVSALTSLEVSVSSVNQLSLACGFPSPSIVVSGIAGMAVALGTLLLAPTFGIAGAALAWGMARIVMFVLYPLLVHRLILQDGAKKWFLRDTLPLLALGGLCFGCGSFLMQLSGVSYNSLSWIPIMVFSSLLYLCLALALNLIPDWKDLIRS